MAVVSHAGFSTVRASATVLECVRPGRSAWPRQVASTGRSSVTTTLAVTFTRSTEIFQTPVEFTGPLVDSNPHSRLIPNASQSVGGDRANSGPCEVVQ